MKKKKKEIRDCLGCGKPMVNPRSNRKYHNDSCRHKAWRQDHPIIRLNVSKKKSISETNDKPLMHLTVRVSKNTIEWYRNNFTNRSHGIRKALEKYMEIGNG